MPAKQRTKTQLVKRHTMGFNQQQELLREHYIVIRPLSVNEALMLRELAKLIRRTHVSNRANASWLAAGAGISTSAAQRALRKLRDRHLVHCIPAYGYRLRVAAR